MDLHRTPSHAPLGDIEPPKVVAGPPALSYPPEPPCEGESASEGEAPSSPKARYAHPDADVRIAERDRREAELGALEAQILELWGNINAATARFLELVAEFDRKEGWAQHGVVSCAHWLSWQCGIGPGAAREKVRVARALGALPKIGEAFGEGRLSYSKVRALTRGATAETEDTLLHIALNGTAAHLERTVRGFRRVRRYLERDAAAAMQERRYLDWRRESDGSVRIEARLTPEVGEMLHQALEAAHAQLEERGGDAEGAKAGTTSGNAEGAGAVASANAMESAEDADEAASVAAAPGVSAETPPTRSAPPPCLDTGPADVSAETRRPQSAPTSLNATPENVSAETSGPRPMLPPCWNAAPENVSAETPPRSISQRRADALEHIVQRFLAGGGSGSKGGSGSGAHELVVHIAHDALRDVPESTGASFEHGGAVAVETARRLGCDGALVGVVKGNKGEPLAVGRRTRAVPPAIRRALRVRDGGCRFPGCGRSRYVHAHHIKHWADGGETSLDNLVTLCSLHHRKVHEGGYGVRVCDGEIEFTRPDGRVIMPAGQTHEGRFRGNISSESGDAPAAGGAQRLTAFNSARGLAIDADTARCRWRGERMDYDTAIDGLCRQAGYT